MTPNWDENSAELCENLEQATRRLEEETQRRDVPSLEAIKKWHALTMGGLSSLEHPDMAGGFRGEPNLSYDIRVGRNRGAASEDVAGETIEWIGRFKQAVEALDAAIPPCVPPDDNASLRQVVRVAAWAHAEWVRIHPFCNGNGRTARMIANYVFIRYSLPPCVRLRPRPEETSYAVASENAMRKKDDYSLMYELFLKWLVAHLQVWQRSQERDNEDYSES